MTTNDEVQPQYVVVVGTQPPVRGAELAPRADGRLMFGWKRQKPMDEREHHEAWIANRGNCRACGSTREACDQRIMVYPKRCCPACKESGPAINHERG